MLPFVSVIMPIRNEESFIGSALDSIFYQDYPLDRYEVLVVDGRSDDRTREIVVAKGANRTNLRLLDNPKRIVPSALNIGLAQSRGEVIIRVDGHVLLEPEYISTCIHYLQTTTAACVGGVISSINHTFFGGAIAMAMSSSFGVGNAHFRTRGTAGKEGYVDCLAFGAYRREVFNQLGGFDEELVRCQDDEFNYRLRKFGGKIFLSPKIRSFYFTRSSPSRLFRQYFQYGEWKIRVLKKHFSMMQIRQFVPPVFVLALLLGLLTAPFSPLGRWLLLGIGSSYTLCCLLASLQACRQGQWKYLPVLPFIFFILHSSYGLGFLYGLIKEAMRTSAKTETIDNQPTLQSN